MRPHRLCDGNLIVGFEIVGAHRRVRPVQQVEILRAGGLPLEFCAYDKGHTIDQEAELPAIAEFLRRNLTARAGDENRGR